MSVLLKSGLPHWCTEKVTVLLLGKEIVQRNDNACSGMGSGYEMGRLGLNGCIHFAPLPFIYSVLPSGEIWFSSIRLRSPNSFVHVSSCIWRMGSNDLSHRCHCPLQLSLWSGGQSRMAVDALMTSGSRQIKLNCEQN